MKIKENNGIKRVEHPKWAGWKLLDFYNSINANIFNSNECRIIKILEENFILVKKLEENIEQKY